jgi:hypothetical protein
MSRIIYIENESVTVGVDSRPPLLAIIGLILSALGWLTCGVTAVLGVPLCLISLFIRGSKGAGIAGVFIGLPTIAVLVLVLLITWGVRTAANVAQHAAENIPVLMAKMAREKLEGEPTAIEVLGVIETMDWDLLRSGEESRNREQSISAFRVKGSRNSGIALIQYTSENPDNANPKIRWAILVQDDGSEIPLVDNN